MKIFLCVIIVFFSGAIGIGIKNEICKKHQLFTEIYSFLQYLYVKIAFFKDFYADSIANFASNNQIKNQCFFKMLYNLIKNANFTFENFKNNVKKYNLNDKEITEIFNIFSSITTCDALNAIQVLQGNIKQLETKLASLEKQKTTKGEVASKLGICLGLVICILLF